MERKDEILLKAIPFMLEILNGEQPEEIEGFFPILEKCISSENEQLLFECADMCINTENQSIISLYRNTCIEKIKSKNLAADYIDHYCNCFTIDPAEVLQVFLTFLDELS